MSGIFILPVNPVGGHFIPCMIEHNCNGPMGNARINRMGKQGFDHLWSGRSCDIPILRTAPQKGIPDASPYSIGIIPLLLKSVYNLLYVFW